MKTLVLLFIIAYGTATQQGNRRMDFANMNREDIIRMIFNLDNDSVKKCIDNGDIAVLEHAQGAGQRLLSCVEPNKNLSSSITTTWSTDRQLSTEEAATLCREYPATQQNCTLEYQESLRPCLSDSDMKAVQLLFNMTYADNRYTCANNGRVLTGLDPLGAQQCVSQSSQELMLCLIPFMEPLFSSDFSVLSVSRFISSQEGCRLYREGVTCFQEAMESCVDRSFADIMIGSFNASLSVMPECATIENNHVHVIRVRRALKALESLSAPSGVEKLSMSYFLKSSFN